MCAGEEVLEYSRLRNLSEGVCEFAGAAITKSRMRGGFHNGVVSFNSSGD